MNTDYIVFDVLPFPIQLALMNSILEKDTGIRKAVDQVNNT